jgi:UDPglucose 6-dehydrogenase
VYDPEANENAHRAYPDLDYADTLDEAVAGAEVVVLLTEWEEFRDMDPTTIGKLVAKRRVVDGRHALDADRYREAGWEYRALGRPVDPSTVEFDEDERDSVAAAPS